MMHGASLALRSFGRVQTKLVPIATLRYHPPTVTQINLTSPERTKQAPSRVCRWFTRMENHTMSKSTKRQRQLRDKKARKAAQYTPARNGVGNSKYARKIRQQVKGNFSPASPFRGEVIT